MQEAFHDEVDSTMAVIYARRSDGQVINLSSVEYSIVRESEPIYQLGSPMPYMHVRGKRHVSGTLYLPNDSYWDLMAEDGFDIHIQHKEAHIILERAKFMDSRCVLGEDRYICTFICRDVDKEKVEALEKMSNRELAKRLLSKEY
jgi:hypothetical protein